MRVYHINGRWRAAWGVAGIMIMLRLPVWSESFTTNRIVGIYTNSGSVYYVGATGSSNELEIASGGWLESTSGIVGQAATADGNRAVVRGAGSLWQNEGGFYVGHGGSGNKVEVSQSGMLQARATIAGYQTGASSNQIQIRGAGTRWASYGGFWIGEQGWGNQLRLEGGARLETGLEAAIGHTAQTRGNTAIVSGPGTAWSHSFLLMVGAYGADDNQMFIQDRAWVYCVHGRIGNGTGNRVWVVDPGTLWQCALDLSVGDFGEANSLVISNGASAICAGGHVSGSSNEVLVIGPGSVWDAGGPRTQLVIGEQGRQNRVRVSDGAGVQSQLAFLIGDFNRIEVIGAGSFFHARESLVVGRDFNIVNSVRVESQGRMSADTWTMGGDVGDCLVSGVGSELIVTNALKVGGDQGRLNQLRVMGGGQLRSGAGILGGAETAFSPHDRNNANSVEVAGAGSMWQAGGEIWVGSTGSDTRCLVWDGGGLTCGGVAVAYHSTSLNNELQVSGGGSYLQAAGDVIVGYGGSDSRLWVTNGGTVFGGDGQVGRGVSSRNLAVVSGPGTVWHCSGHLGVGDSGSSNRMLVVDGAIVRSLSGSVGGPQSTPLTKGNQVHVSGPGTRWTNRAELAVGVFGSFCELSVQNGGEVGAARFRLGNAVQTLNNACRVTAGGRLVIDSTVQGSGGIEVESAGFLLDGGQVIARSLRVRGGPMHPWVFASGTLEVDRGMSISNGLPFLVGSGQASAELILRGESHEFAQGLVIQTQAMGRISGVVAGSLTNSGRLEVGHPIGSLPLSGSMQLLPSSEVGFDLGGFMPGTGHDFIRVTNTLAMNGRIRVRLTNGFIPFSAAILTLMEFGSGQGSFVNATHGNRVTVEGTSNSFRVDYTATQLRLTDFEGPDALPDEDGIDDAWALEYFGHSPLTGEELAGDQDGDGQTTYQEYVANTNPIDGDSVFRVVDLRLGAGSALVIRFPCAENRVYRILHSADLQQWQEVPNPILQTVSPGWCEWVEVLEDGQSALAERPPARWYQVEVRLP